MVKNSFISTDRWLDAFRREMMRGGPDDILSEITIIGWTSGCSSYRAILACFYVFSSMLHGKDETVRARSRPILYFSSHTLEITQLLAEYGIFKSYRFISVRM